MTIAPISARPVRYRIVYRVEDRAGPDPKEHWEELVARRPYAVRNGTYDHRPAFGEPPAAGTLTTVDHLYTFGPSGLQAIAGRQPAVGVGDQALGPLLADAVGRGMALPRGRRQVASRSCQVVRVSEPPAGPLKVIAGADHDELCIDDDGLVLREEWTLAGRVVQRREAVEVEVEPAAERIDPLLDSSGAAPFPALLPRPSIAPLGSDDVGVSVPSPPTGFTSTSALRFSLPDPQAPGSLSYSSAVWAFERGADLVTVEAGTSRGNPPWSAKDPTEPIRFSGERTGGTVLRSDGSEVRVAVDERRWVRVRGTIPLAELAAYARALALVP